MKRWQLGLAGAFIFAGFAWWALQGGTAPWALSMWADGAVGARDLPSGQQLMERRPATRKAIVDSLGQPPAAAELASPLLEEHEFEASPDAPLFHVRFSLPDGDQGVALIGYPETATPRGLVVALHQTSDEGMKEVMGVAGLEDLAYGRAMVKAGYVVISPDAFATGERAEPSDRWLTGALYQQHPEWSAMGKMLSDHQAALDAGIELYRQHYGNEPACISAVGHSLGAHNALFLAVFDERLDAVVANAGFERIASDDDAIRWSRDGGFIYMPKLKEATRGLEPLPWDWEDVLAQIYPRGVYVSQGLQDPIFTHEISVAQAAQSAEAAYAEGGYADRFEAHFWYGGHAFPEKYQRAATDFIGDSCKADGEM